MNELLLTEEEIHEAVFGKEGYDMNIAKAQLAKVLKAGYVKLADMRKAIAIEYKKAVEESEASPFQVMNLDNEHRLLWKGHANAYSEMLSYLDEQAGGE